MSGEGGSVDVRTMAEVAEMMRKLLVTIDDGQLSCSAAYRNRLQGAVVALESLAQDSGDRVAGAHRVGVRFARQRRTSIPACGAVCGELTA